MTSEMKMAVAVIFPIKPFYGMSKSWSNVPGHNIPDWRQLSDTKLCVLIYEMQQ